MAQLQSLQIVGCFIIQLLINYCDCISEIHNECGDSIYISNLTAINHHYYVINVTKAQTMSFDACFSAIPVKLELHYQFNGANQYFMSNDWSECNLGLPTLIIDTLPATAYLLNISSIDGNSSLLDDYYVNVDIYCVESNVLKCGDSTQGELSPSQPDQFRLIMTPLDIRGVVHITPENDRNIRYNGSIITFDAETNMITLLFHIETLKHITVPWSMDFLCIDTFTNNNESYAMITFADYDISWMDAAILCIQEYGTSLATIETYWDLIEANYAVNRSIDIDYGEVIDLYIGLYSEPEYFFVNGTSTSIAREWKWLMNNGSNCNACVEYFRNMSLDTEKYYGVQMSFPLIFQNDSRAIPVDAGIPLDNSGMLCNGMTYK